MAGAFCAVNAVTVKVNATTVGSQGFQDCEGGVAVQRMTVYLEVCDVNFGICFHWTTFKTYGSCAKFGAGSFSCPAAGTFNRSPGPGKWRTRVFGEVNDTSGGYASGQVWGAEVQL